MNVDRVNQQLASGAYGRKTGRAGAEEREAVVGNDPERLNDVTRRKDALLLGIARADARRVEWIGANCGDPAMSLATVLVSLPADEASAVGARRDELMGLLRDVAEMNFSNGQLVSSSLRLVDRQIDGFSRIRDAAGYQATGERARSARTAVLDYK